MKPGRLKSTFAIAIFCAATVSWTGCSPDDDGPQEPTDAGADAAQNDVADVADSATDTGSNEGDADAAEDAGDQRWSTTRNVLVLNYDPIVDSTGNRIHEEYNWSDPRELAEGYAADMNEASEGAVSYEIVEWKDLDVYPVKEDGFRYTDESYAECAPNWDNCHDPDAVDYSVALENHDVCSRVTSGDVDEVWMFGAPYFGYWESTMVGDGAYWVNSPPVEDYDCSRQFIVMGFSYERGVAEMLHNFGHLTESIMTQVFRNWSGDDEHPWAKYARHETSHPGEARCGNTHFPPNGAQDYDYANPREVESLCHVYENYPDLSGEPRTVSCDAWNCDQRDYMKWLLDHLPRAEGTTDGYQNDWWKYLVRFNEYVE